MINAELLTKIRNIVHRYYEALHILRSQFLEKDLEKNSRLKLLEDTIEEIKETLSLNDYTPSNWYIMGEMASPK